MKKFIIALIFVAFTAVSCEKDEVENPAWLTELINKIKTDSSYTGSKIYKHEWKSSDYYELNQPISSCLFCKVYNKDGKLVNWSDEDMESYLNERKNEEVIWQWGDN